MIDFHFAIFYGLGLGYSPTELQLDGKRWILHDVIVLCFRFNFLTAK